MGLAQTSTDLVIRQGYVLLKEILAFLTFIKAEPVVQEMIARDPQLVGFLEELTESARDLELTILFIDENKHRVFKRLVTVDVELALDQGMIELRQAQLYSLIKEKDLHQEELALAISDYQRYEQMVAGLADFLSALGQDDEAVKERIQKGRELMAGYEAYQMERIQAYQGDQTVAFDQAARLLEEVLDRNRTN